MTFLILNERIITFRVGAPMTYRLIQQSISNHQREDNHTAALGLGWDKCKYVKSVPKILPGCDS
jgi:hypothetical protein